MMATNTPLLDHESHAYGQASTASPGSSPSQSPRRQRSLVYGQHTDEQEDHGGAASRSTLSLSFHGNGNGTVSGYLDGSADFDELEDSVRQSRTIEDFTRIIQDFRHDRNRRGTSSGSHNRDSRYSDLMPNGLAPGSSSVLGSAHANASSSAFGSDDGGGKRRSWDEQSIMSHAGHQAWRCTCCCSKDDCERARRATQEWRDMEQDLKLAAEIGQALLKRHDAAVLQASKDKESFVKQRDSLMNRLTQSIKESSGLERQLAQVNLNLEAADSSNRTLLHELDDLRLQNGKLRTASTKLTSSESKNRDLHRELEDIRQELDSERRRSEAAETRLQKSLKRTEQLSESLKVARREVEISEDRERKFVVGEAAIKSARERLMASLPANMSASVNDASVDMDHIIDGLSSNNESLEKEVQQLKSLLEASNNELGSLREAAQAGAGSSTAVSISVPPEAHDASLTQKGRGFSDSYFVPHPTFAAQADALTGADGSAGMAPVLSNEIVTEPLPRSETPVEAPAPGSAAAAQRSTSPTSSTRSDRKGQGRVVSSPSWEQSAPLSPTRRQTSRTRTSVSTSDAAKARAQEDAQSVTTITYEQTTAVDRDETQQEVLRKERDVRTAQLNTLLEHITRLFSRLSMSDVDTLSRRLQKQHLTGDVGHLARTTVNAIVRDVDNLRDHFRRLIENENRANLKDDGASAHSGSANTPYAESMVVRKDFFALIKVFRELLVETARLRAAINEIQLQPSQAAKLLQEHLGVAPEEDKSLLPVGGWISRMFTGAPTSAAPAAGSTASSSAAASVSAALSKPTQPAGPQRSRSRDASSALGLGGRKLAPRASAAAAASTVAVEVKGSYASAGEHRRTSSSSNLNADISPPIATAQLSTSPPVGGSLRVNSRPQPARGRTSLSGLWDPSSLGASATRHGGGMSARQSDQRPLSRIVDDDEVSHGRRGGDADAFPAALTRTLRPRGLSDSSMHSTFLEHGDASPTRGGGRGGGGAAASRPSPISRIITPSTLALQVSSSSGPSAAVLGDGTPAGALSPALSEDSNSTTGATGGGAPLSRTRSYLGKSIGIPSLKPGTSAASISLAGANIRGRTTSGAASSPSGPVSPAAAALLTPSSSLSRSLSTSTGAVSPTSLPNSPSRKPSGAGVRNPSSSSQTSVPDPRSGGGRGNF